MRLYPEVRVTLALAFSSRDFKRAMCTRLRDYLIVRALNGTNRYEDVFNAGDELTVRADSYGVAWSRGDADTDDNVDVFWVFDEVCEDDVTRVMERTGVNRAAGEDAAERLGRACDNFLAARGPFDIDVDAVPVDAWLVVAEQLFSLYAVDK